MPAIPPIPAVIAPQPESFMKLRLSKRAMASSPSNFLLRGDCMDNPVTIQGHVGVQGLIAQGERHGWAA
jgi:hypothetical protein